ncbi:DUF2812 domain-containing protein [Psychrobacillus psychrodurans]|uniref:DUF2812 domain-containing protein n=1 Tax=Psychrobacillus psychrodurans TaxID=126157 RepID=UPI0022B9D233|nr:DUF2812 domain-containing protein [Psychrobacillus psychrodurans]MCZ8540207.1 DUF2812 domain-containing protein [Psychrobacillus psychrodurans]
MIKFKVFSNAHKEEQWLNKMLQNGWQLKSVNAFNVYSFEKTSNKEQILRLDCQSFASEQKFQQYKALYEEFGWVHLGGSRLSTLQYWLNSNSIDDLLFSDQFSEKHYLHRLRKIYGVYACFSLFITFCLFQNSAHFLTIKDAYYTPGLWDKNGFDFLGAFLFETPLAITRFGSPWLMLIFGLVSINMYFKYKREIDKSV